MATELEKRADVSFTEVDIEPTSRRGPSSFPTVASLGLRGQGVDVLLCAGSFVPKTDVPTVFWPLTVGPLEAAARDMMRTSRTSRPRQRALVEALRIAVGRSDALIFSSHYAHGLFAGAFAASSRRPTLVVHPAQPETQLRWSGTGANLLTASRMSLYKRLPTIVDGFAGSRLAEQRGVALDVAGLVKPEVLANLGAYASHARVNYLGDLDRPDLYTRYVESGGFIFGSMSENAASYALIDAMAMGVPCLSAGESSISEIARDGVYYVRPFGPAQLSMAVDRLVGDSEFRGELSERASASASRLPTWTQISDAVVEFASAL